MKAEASIPDINKLLPQDPEAEQGLICSFLLNPSEIGSMCAERHMTESDFHVPRHAILFRHLNEAWANNQPLDFITLTGRLRDANQLDEVGGPAYVTGLFTLLGTSAHAGNYAETLAAKSALRRLIAICEEHRARGMDEQDEPEKVILSAQQAIAAIGLRETRPRRSFRELLMDTIDSIEQGDQEAHIRTGIEGLDNRVKMERGNFVVFCGEAKSGKTALAGTVLVHAAVRQERRCVMFSLEMTETEIARRCISVAGRINLNLIGSRPSENDIAALTRAMNALGSADVEVVSDCVDLGAIIGRARQLHALKPIDLLVLDYLQLVEYSTGRKGETRQEVVAQISRTCKRLAGEFQCVVIGLSQLNDDGKLRESRAIGQDANAVVSVEKEKDGGRKLFIVAQRNGVSGESIAVQWLPQYTKFEAI